MLSERNAKKLTVSFAFSAHVDGKKYRKTLTFHFHCKETWSFSPSLSIKKTFPIVT